MKEVINTRLYGRIFVYRVKSNLEEKRRNVDLGRNNVRLDLLDRFGRNG